MNFRLNIPFLQKFRRFGGVSVVRATPADALEITQIHIEAWIESYRGILTGERLEALGDQSLFDSRVERRREILSNPVENGCYFRAIIGGKTVGFLDAGPIARMLPDTPGEIYAIYVSKRATRKGVGRSLMRAARRHLVDHGLVPYVAWVLHGNHNARAFYERTGGILVKETEEETTTGRRLIAAYRFTEE